MIGAPALSAWWVEARLLAGVGWAGRLGGWCDPARTLEPAGGWRADPRLGGRLGGRAFCPGPGLLPVVLTSLGTRKDKLRFPLFCVWFYCFVFALRPRWTAQARRVSVALGLPCASPRRPLGGARAAPGITFSKRRGRCFLKFEFCLPPHLLSDSESPELGPQTPGEGLSAPCPAHSKLQTRVGTSWAGAKDPSSEACGPLTPALKE